jgi:methionyl-tRNA formyltransferase
VSENVGQNPPNTGARFICLAGKNDVASNSLLHLASSKLIPADKILVLPGKKSRHLEFMRSLQKTAEQLDLCVIDGIEKLYDLPHLIFISLEYDAIIDTKKFISSELFNIHFSKLPAYRGMYTSAWPILNGESVSGVTLHKIDDGIDTGDIIDQLVFPLAENDTARDLYVKHNAFGVDVFKKNIRNLLNGTYKATPQDTRGASYYSKKSIDYKNIVIDLHKTAREVHNQIRAFVFPEYQYPKVYGHSIVGSEVTVKKSSLDPGALVEDGERHMVLATKDFNIKLLKKY